MKTKRLMKLQVKVYEELGQPQILSDDTRQKMKESFVPTFQAQNVLVPQNGIRINFLHYFDFLPTNVNGESGKRLHKKKCPVW
jgi:hypothetical protein